MFHDPLVAEVRRVRADIMSEHAGDLHALGDSLRAEQLAWESRGHPIIPTPDRPEILARILAMIEESGRAA